LQKTFNIRYPIYKSADIKINNNNIPIQYVIDYIVDLIDNYYKKKQFFKVMNNIVPVELGKRSYNINISDKLQNINIKSDVDKVFILTDDIVSKIYLQQIESSITQNNKKLLCQSIIIENGEQSKNIIKAGEIIEEILSYKPTRKSILIALGGGVVGDITGFVASTILRGIDFIQIPTTLLSQVDSSVGGKTGVNSKYGKNLIGAFHQPIAVYIYLDMLHSLNQREFNSGYAEVLKYAMIRKKDFFEQLNNNIDLIKQRDLKILSSIISTSCKTKATIVSEDEKESGNRALLNFGHTFGHAIEGALQYNKEVINHGEAVAIGMVMATAFSVYLKYCKIDVLNQLKAHLMSMGIATQLQDMNINISNEDLVKYMHSDKKKLGNNLTFILLNDLGDAFIAKNIADNVVLDFLNSELC